MLSWIFLVVNKLIQARPYSQHSLSSQPYYTYRLEASLERTSNNTFKKKNLPFSQPQSNIIKKKFFNTATLTLPLGNRHFVFHISWAIFGTAPAPFGIRTSSGSWLTVEIFTLAHFLWGTFPREGSLCSSQPESAVLSSIQRKASHSRQAHAHDSNILTLSLEAAAATLDHSNWKHPRGRASKRFRSCV